MRFLAAIIYYPSYAAFLFCGVLLAAIATIAGVDA